MSKDKLYKFKYPIGEFNFSGKVASDDLENWIREVDQFPHNLSSTSRKLKPKQLDTPYRPGGWTVRQLIHHIADSHLNAYVRFKLALTEDTPTIKPYDQSKWAELKDSEQFAVSDSLTFIALLHKRWVILLKSMSSSDFERELNHPESGVHSLKVFLGLYAWHGKHHLSHIVNLIKREGWQ